MRRKALLCAIVAFAACLAGFAAGGDNVINYYTDGSDNVRIVWEAVIDAFNKKNTGVTVNLQYLASGSGGQTGADKLIAAVKAGAKNVDIDILEVDASRVVRIQKEAGPNALLKLDMTKVPNSKSLVAKSIVAPEYVMPYRGTAVFIAYNSAKVPTPPKTVGDLTAWIKSHPGRFAYNDPATGGAGGAYVRTSVYNYLPAEALLSDDEKWMAQWDKGLAYLAEIHPFLYKASGKVQYTVKNQGSLDLLAAGSIDMCPAWADQVLDQKSKGLLPASIMLAQIDPALTGNWAMLAVPGTCAKTAAVYKFLDFVASNEAQDIFVKVMKAIPVVDPAKLPADTMAMLSGLKAVYRAQTIGGLETKLNQRWTQEISTLP